MTIRRPARPLVCCAGLAQCPDRAGAEPELTVFAAASLTGAFQEIGGDVRAGAPGNPRAASTSPGSQQLATAARAGRDGRRVRLRRPALDGLRRREGSGRRRAARLFAHNRLVVIVPATNPARIGRLQDLAKRGVKFVVAAEAVPVGQPTPGSRSPSWRRRRTSRTDYDRRVLANVVSQEENVKAVVTKVQLGEADAGVVYASDATRLRRPPLAGVPHPRRAERHRGLPDRRAQGRRARRRPRKISSSWCLHRRDRTC